MKTSSKYRLGALVLAAVFSLFNIGLPIVIASCLMVESTQSPLCCSCTEEQNDAAEKLTGSKNTLCCTTVTAADKNSTEFVLSKFSQEEICKFFPASFFPGEINNTLQRHSFIAQKEFSPPLFTDIPIFTSSLLI